MSGTGHLDAGGRSERGDADGDRGADLYGRLSTAETVAEAASIVVDHLVAHGLTLPSLYLEQGGRLRCAAQRGYWQVLDGIPTDVGVMSRALATGGTVTVDDASTEAAFLYAAPDLQRQIAVPVRYGDAVVGALNVESDRPFPPGARAITEAAAAAFEIRLAELGGPPAESLAQQVARLVSSLTELDDEPALRRAVVEAAVELSGMGSAAIVEADEPGRARVIEDVGSLGPSLRAVAPEDLGALDAFVLPGTSLHARGTDVSDLEMHGRLRTAGVVSLVVVSLTGGGAHLGSLVVVSRRSHELAPAVVPVLEILGAQAGASIRALRDRAELRRLARQDPLTKLGHHATFQEELRTRLACRRRDRDVAVLVIDVDGFKDVNDRLGHQAGDRILKDLSASLAAALRDDDQLYRIGGDEFATVIEVRSLDEASDVAGRLLEVARTGTTTISVGVAVASPDEPPERLLDRADAAMYEAKVAGRDTLGVARADQGFTRRDR
jgi:diguanylate cyclase (GGDEF)-like protein